MRLLILIICFCCVPVFAQQQLSGQVIGVSDGDTATILTADRKPVKIRLAQIDAPEKAQAFGERSKQSLSDLIYGKNVIVDVETTDKYGRTVGKIIVAGIDANLEQIKRGMAWFYVQYGKDAKYRDAESKAKSAKLGLWSEAAPTPPWEWRHSGKATTASNTTQPVQAKQPINTTSSSASFSCGSKRYCKEMSSCEEAKFYLQHCGATRIDGDGDGVPCEKLCN
ncbi:thermonuclease family protein [Deefgea tanakiae]|uniref:Thermonuclease family protein n=1 Tax=Deefgea tanakiae TaxID=2865840 RepID=A0ABX8ZAS8_9NEIS|nr:thermonuclease family protein [Deefgea tanakiae]QZA79555.1 thermonuclease family protein [Deefgea tanakiae]